MTRLGQALARGTLGLVLLAPPPLAGPGPRPGAGAGAGNGPGKVLRVAEIELQRLGAGRWPRAMVLELPEGFLQPGERPCLRARSGKEIPLAVDPPSSWSAGRPRWCRLRFAELPEESRKLQLSTARGAVPRPALRLEGRGGTGALHADRGLGQWDPGGLRVGPFRFDWETSAVEADGRVLEWSVGPRPRTRGPDASGFGLQLDDRGGAASSAFVLSVAWEVSSRGTCSELSLRLQAHAPCVVRRWTLRGRADEAVDLLADSRRNRSRSEREIVTSRSGPGFAARGGTEVPGAVSLACRGRRLVWADFSAGPSGVWCDARGRFRLDLVAQDVLLEAGQTLHRVLRFGPDTGAATRSVLLRRTPRWRLMDAERDWVRGWVRLLQREVGGCARCEDRGCYPSSDGGFANGEYDLAHSLLDWGQAEADPVALDLGLCMAQHQRAFDRATEPPDGWPEGLFWMHGREHRSERLEAGHVWLGGLLAAARVSGQPGAWHDAVGVLAAVEQLEAQGDKLSGPERRLVWPLWAALEAGGLDARASAVAGRLLDRLLARQGARGWIEGDLRRQQGRELLWVNSWVSLGLTVPTLLRAARELDRPEAGASARRLASAVFEAARSRDGLAEVLLIDPVFGDCVGRRGRCKAGGGALAAAGLIAASEAGAIAAQDFAAAMWDQALASLGPPCVEDTTEFAKALHALRLLASCRASVADRR